MASREGIKTKKHPQCPSCESDSKVVPIVYGELPYDPERRGTFVAGGCCVRNEQWHCKACKTEWV